MLSSAWIAVMYSLRDHEANDDPKDVDDKRGLSIRGSGHEKAIIP